MAERNTFNALDALKKTEAFWKRRIASADISDHPTSKGNVAEAAWRELLGQYLPTRYRVGTGFVISTDGGISDQIDCVVYDNVYTPTFFGEHGLCYIPAEAVHAVFEVKQNVTTRDIEYAAKKAQSVRDLHRTTGTYTGDGRSKSPKPHFAIIGGLMARRIKGKKWEKVIPALKALQRPVPDAPPRLLDIVFTAEDGVADYLMVGGNPDPDAPDEHIPSPTIHCSENSGLMMGVLRLVHALQGQGTVPAIEWKDWLSNLKP